MIGKPKSIEQSEQQFTAYEQQQVYTPLGEAAAGHTDSYNVYGVVIDAISPYIKNKPTC